MDGKDPGNGSGKREERRSRESEKVKEEETGNGIRLKDHRLRRSIALGIEISLLVRMSLRQRNCSRAGVTRRKEAARLLADRLTVSSLLFPPSLRTRAKNRP